MNLAPALGVDVLVYLPANFGNLELCENVVLREEGEERGEGRGPAERIESSAVPGRCWAQASCIRADFLPNWFTKQQKQWHTNRYRPARKQVPRVQLFRT